MSKAEIITKCIIENDGCIHQGDILNNVDYIEYVNILNGNIEISKITFPKVIVLTQECDSVQYYNNRNKNYSIIDGKEQGEIKTNQFLLSIIVAPLYNFNDVISGNHLSEIKIMKDNLMTDTPLTFDHINSKEKKKIENNSVDRYHYLKLEINGKYLEYVIDFKQYFTVNTEKIIQHKQNGNYFASIDILFRESLSQRFSNFLSRIGLPETQIED